MADAKGDFMKFDKKFIMSIAKGEGLELVKILTPKQAFQLGLEVKKYEQSKK